ncbi:hypothetical protein KZQ40_001543 [Campylobacter coli]|nr:hypothetical protein [Campylobacter coli]
MQQNILKIKKNALLILAVTSNYVFSAANVLIGLKKYSPNMFDDILIYTDDNIDSQDKIALKKIFPNILFKKYSFQIENIEDRERLRYYSNMPYARFEMLSYLEEYAKVVWFDSDFLILDDISDLLKYGDTGIAMSLDLDPYPLEYNIKPFFIKDVAEYNMNAKAYASGLIIFTDKLKNPLEIRKYLYDKLNQYSSYIRYAEQGILQFMIEDFKLKVDEIPKLIYHAFPIEDKTQAKLIHLLGDSKPWLNYSGSAYDEWYENHKFWIKLGGSEAYSFKQILGADKSDFNSCYELFEYKKYQKYFFGEKRYQNILKFKKLDELFGNSSVICKQSIEQIEKIKSHLSYRLGNLLIKHPFTFIFRFFKVYREWRNGK